MNNADSPIVYRDTVGDDDEVERQREESGWTKVAEGCVIDSREF
jgi:hypothetical protein